MNNLPSRRPPVPARPRPRFFPDDSPPSDPLGAFCREIYAEGLAQGHRDALADAQPRFEQELLRAKLDAMKELAYGASHEINNPLANIALRAQTLLKREDDADKRKMLTAMHRAAMRAHEMISDLMLYARPPKPKPEEVSLRSVAGELIEESIPLAAEQGVTLTLLEGADAMAWADPNQVAVAIRALIDNSLEAIHDGGEIALVVRSGDDGWTEVEVRDNGPGIPEAIRPHIFDPFFSGREAGRGLGFGLSKCWRIVTQHGGEVLLESEPGKGVSVVITLPSAVASDRRPKQGEPHGEFAQAPRL